MCILLALVSPVTIFCGSSSSCFPLRNLIPFRVSLVLEITSTFGFTLTICVEICTIACCFTDESYVLICFLFPPRFSSSSILSNLYSCTGGGSYFSRKYNLLSFSFLFLALSLMVVFCTVPSINSKNVGLFAEFDPSNLCHSTSHVKTTRLVAGLYIQYVPVAEFSAYPTIIAGNPCYVILPLILSFFATYTIIPNCTRQLNQFLTLFPVQAYTAGSFWSTFNIMFTRKPLQLTAYAHSFTCVYFSSLARTITVIDLSQIKFIFLSNRLFYLDETGAVYSN